MGRSQVCYVYVIPEACPVSCRVIITEDLNFFVFSSDSPQNSGDQVGFRVV